MNIHFQKIKPVLHLSAWALLIALCWFIWLSRLEGSLYVGNKVFVVVFGVFVGMVSKLPPKKVFLVCFSGFFIIAVLLGLIFPIFEDLVVFGVLCGIFGIAGAVIRRIVTHQRIEELYLSPLEWTLLIGGVSALADYLIILGAYRELLVYHRLTIFLKLFVPALIGLFALGVYTGTFYQLQYKKLTKSVKWVSLAGHGIFVVYMFCLFVTGHTSRKSFLFIPVIGIFFIVFFKGVQLGYGLRDRIKIHG
jgi:hypothetical protein